MPAHNTTATPRRWGSPDKRRAILSGAFTVFARDGYARANIDAIATAAQVSTRTIYNHFADKADLFNTLIDESATRVAHAQIAIIDEHLSTVTDLRADLLAFGQAWAAPVPEHAQHFALVRHINADSAHIPQATITAWQQAGPLRVRRELARRLQHLVDRELLRVADPDRMAQHLVLLTAVANPALPTAAASQEEITELVTSGILAFLYGYLP
ncbi:MAG: TetR/AcrR family transcriptional regulator [Sciscionella sp.]